MARYSGWIDPARQHGIYARDDQTCCYCGLDMHNTPDLRTLDHLKPWSVSVAAGEKPDHTSANLVTCCGYCNSSRGNRALDDFAPGGALIRIAIQTAKAVDSVAGKAAWLADRRRRGYDLEQTA